MAQWTSTSRKQINNPVQVAVLPLLTHLSENISIMQKIVRRIGTKLDTQDERKNFKTISKESRGVFQQATKLMSNINSGNPDNYKQAEKELIEYSRQFRQVMQQYISKRQKHTLPYKAQNINETDPLLTSSINSKQFNPNQSSYPYKYQQKQKQKQKQNKNKNKKSMNKNNNSNSITNQIVREDNLNHDDHDIFDQRYMTQVTIHSEEKMLENRDSEMGEIVHSLQEVNEIYQELLDMCKGQNDIIDDFEDNITSVHDNVNQGSQQLHKAEKNLKKSRRNRCMLLLFLFIGLVALVCIIWAMQTSREHN